MEDKYGGEARIIQMIPAPGWFAVYNPVTTEDHGPHPRRKIVHEDVPESRLETFPLVCWVLMERIYPEGSREYPNGMVDSWVDAIDTSHAGDIILNDTVMDDSAFREFRYDPARGSGQTNK